MPANGRRDLIRRLKVKPKGDEMKLNLTVRRWAMKTESGGSAPCILDINIDELCCQFHLPPPVVGWVGPTVSVEMVANIGSTPAGA